MIPAISGGLGDRLRSIGTKRTSFGAGDRSAAIPLHHRSEQLPRELTSLAPIASGVPIRRKADRVLDPSGATRAPAAPFTGTGKSPSRAAANAGTAT